jgi:hypothetical protein
MDDSGPGETFPALTASFRGNNELRLQRLSIHLLLWCAAIRCFGQATPAAASEQFQYEVEWRLIRAGTAVLKLAPQQGELSLKSQGLVSKLYPVEDEYRTKFDAGTFCTQSIELNAKESKRHRWSNSAFDPQAKTIKYVEKDLLKNGHVLEDKVLTADQCVAGIVTGLNWVRGQKLNPGQTAWRWFSEGKKAANVKVEALDLTKVKTPAGTFDVVRHEVHIMNNVIYRRNGRLFLYLTNDDRRLPVKVEAKMSTLIGNINVNLEKIGS